MPRIVCISNRVSLPEPDTGEIMAGGLAVGVKAALESSGGGIWFGWDGSIQKSEETNREVTSTDVGNITFLTIPLRQLEYDEYYKSLANENLWPLMHGLRGCLEERPKAYSIYTRVNRMFAKRIKPYLRPGDLIWVHDYHLIPLGAELRSLGIKNRIGYFHHIPIPPQNFINGRDIPVILKWQYQQLVKKLFYYDLVGFQSFRDFRNFCSNIGSKAICPDRFKAVDLHYLGLKTGFGVFPISIETDEIVRAAQKKALQNPVVKDGCQTLIGAERLDYTKGLPCRLAGYYEFLDGHPEYLGHLQYYQITPLSRADIRRYKDEIDNTRQIADEIKEDFDDENIKPLVYTEKAVPREKLMDMLRCSDAGLVTPLIDGQNLVAKEYIAAQDPRDPGMLVLSKNAGAAEELARLGVISVDPTDPSDIAEKINQALNTPLEKRRKIYRRIISYLYHYDIQNWAESFLTELQRKQKTKNRNAYGSHMHAP